MRWRHPAVAYINPATEFVHDCRVVELACAVYYVLFKAKKVCQICHVLTSYLLDDADECGETLSSPANKVCGGRDTVMESCKPDRM
eukprot:scaffold55532_cov17-Prasinocladus_malaysianus.AAC.1